MGKFILKRVLQTIPVLLGVILLVSALLAMAPGDPATTVIGVNATPDEIARFNALHGLDKPFFQRYFLYIYNFIAHGELGTSYIGNRSVVSVLQSAFPVTLQLVLLSTLFMIVVGIPLGVISAYKQYSVFDNIAQTLSIAGVSIPGFWLALMLIITFAVNLGILPVSGWGGFSSRVMPAITVGLSGAASMMRITRSSMLDAIRQDYIKTARAKGQKESVVVVHHMLRNSLLPIITVLGTTMGRLFGGCMAVETIFSIPGLSRQLINSIYSRDYPVVQGAVLLIAFICVSLNLLSDILYALIDPRIKSQFQGKNTAKRKKVAQIEGAQA